MPTKCTVGPAPDSTMRITSILTIIVLITCPCLGHKASLNRKMARLERRMDEMAATVNKIAANKGQQVAFTAHGATGEHVNAVLTFKNVDLNLGGGYNQTTGKFTCPVAGTYLFSATLFSVRSRSEETYCSIYKSVTEFARINSYEGRYDSASVSTIFHLSVGDTVVLGGCGNVDAVYTQNGFTTFIGSLIQAD